MAFKGGISDELAHSTPGTSCRYDTAPPLAAPGRRRRDADGAHHPRPSRPTPIQLALLIPAVRRSTRASFSPGCLPPDLLTLSGLYAATPAQASSLQALQNQAVNNTIDAHGLASDDGDAVLSWGRSDAEAELFALIVQAINTPAASRSRTSRTRSPGYRRSNNARPKLAAQDAGLEYVKWAGLDQSTYSSLIAAMPTRATSSRSSPAATASSPSPTGASGYCCTSRPRRTNRSTRRPDERPDRHGSHRRLSAARRRRATTQFTKWGEADADYSLLSSGRGPPQAGAEIGAALDLWRRCLLGARSAAGAALSSGLAAALDRVGRLQTAIFPYRAMSPTSATPMPKQTGCRRRS